MDYKFGWLFAIVVLSAIQSQAQTNDRENKTPSVPNGKYTCFNLKQ